MTLAEVHVKWSVILIDRLGPDILLAKPEEGNPLFFFQHAERIWHVFFSLVSSVWKETPQ